MSPKALRITLFVFTILIFGGNHYAARNGFQGKSKCNCNCIMAVGLNPEALGLLIGLNDPSSFEQQKTLMKEIGKGKESCSVVFKNEGGKLATQYLPRDGITSFSCGVAVFCERGRNATLLCGRNYVDVHASTKCSLYCLPGGVTASACEPWWNKNGPGNPLKKTPPPKNTPLSMFFTLTKISNSIISTFLPVKYAQESVADEEVKEIMSGPARWRLLEGEAGIEKGSLMVSRGEAEIRSFCTGDTLSLIGPSAVSLPVCQVDVSGRWQGAYGRRLSDGTWSPVTVSLNLRKESGSLRGEFNTAEGIFNIMSASESGSDLNLQAEGTVAGRRRIFRLRGRITKGDIVFDGREESPGGDANYNVTGSVRRLYIADNALPIAILNQPYNFSLLAVSPDGETIRFRVAGGQLPRGVSLDSHSGTFSGTPTERGSFNIHVVAYDAAGNVFEQFLTLTVKKLALATKLLADAFVGQRYAATLKAAGGQPPYRFSGVPPKGLKLDPNTGELAGTPSSANSNPVFEVTVRDSQNNSESQNVSMQVRGTTILTSHFLPDATQGLPYHTQFQVVGISSPVKWSIAEGSISSLGLTLDPQTGDLSGTPTQVGAFRFSVLAQGLDSQSRNFVLMIKQGSVTNVGRPIAEAPRSETDLRREIGRAWNYNPSEHRGKNGQRFAYVCPAHGEPYELYGSDIYADHSSLCTAAVHAGLITFERGGSVTIEIRPGQSSYQGSRRNGVNSRSWHAEDGSFVFVH